MLCWSMPMDELLKQFGLDESEAKVYVALLELGPSTVTDITNKAGVTRTHGYIILEKLGLYGLVTRTKDGGKKMKYLAEHPRSLVQYVKNNKNNWERRIEKAEALLPDLVALYKVHDKPVVRYQEGVRGVESMFEEALESTSEILAVTDVESWQDPAFWEWAKAYNRERNRRKVSERILLLDTPQGRAWIQNYRPTRFTTYRWIAREQAKGLLEFGGELNIYGSRVLIGLPKKAQRFSAVIESNVLANILRSMFEIVWGVATPASLAKRSKNR